MRRFALSDPGTAAPEEDGLIVRPEVCGVVDGLSMIRRPDEGISPGRIVVDILLDELHDIRCSLSQALNTANCRVATFNLGRSDTRLDDPVSLAGGAVFALACIGQDTVEIASSGDSLAVWETVGGEVGFTPNQLWPADVQHGDIKARFMEQFQGDRARLREAYQPLMEAFVREYANVTYAVLNGQPTFTTAYASVVVPMTGVKTLILGTDGLLGYRRDGDGVVHAAEVLALYRQGGLLALLGRAREREREGRSKEAVFHAEATGVAIEF